MKNLKINLLFIFLLIQGVAFCQMQQKIELKLDEIGNSKLNISMTMNAQQWQIWLANIGNNPASLKREIERSMPTYFLDDFKLDKDDMNRSFSLDLNAYGICKIDKRGKWTLDTDQKNAQITELTDHKYMLNSSPPEFGGQMQQSYIIEFPEAAQNIKIDKDAFGQSIFKFEMANSKNEINTTMWSGIILLISGAGVAGFKLFK